MKICLSSDHHYHSYPLFSAPGANGVTTRLAEMLDVEDWLHEYMVANRIEYHIRLGDLFERKGIVDGVVYAEVAERIKRNKEAGVQEIIIKGNHDIAAGGLRNTLESLETGGLAMVVGGLPGNAFPLGSTLFVCIPYDERPGATAEAIDYWVKHLAGSKNAVLLAHCAVEGAVSGSEFPVPASVTQAELQLDKWDHVLLGHVHPPQAIKERLMYVGSFCQRYFTDSGAQRRVLIYDTEATDKLLSIPLPGPRFETVAVKSKAALTKLPVQDNTYYCVVHARSMARRAIDEHFAGAARGYAPQPDAATVTPAAPGAIDRIPQSATTWKEIFAAYVNGQADENLDNEWLSKLGLEFLGSAGV